MTITIDLAKEQADKLDAAARSEGLDLAALMARIAEEYLERKAAFQAASRYVLNKNQELYRRLAQ
jgi:hypothetical protein